MSDWNLVEKLHGAGGMVKGNNLLFRWQDGRPISTRPGNDWVRFDCTYMSFEESKNDCDDVLGHRQVRPSVAVRTSVGLPCSGSS